MTGLWGGWKEGDGGGGVDGWNCEMMMMGDLPARGAGDEGELACQLVIGAAHFTGPRVEL